MNRRELLVGALALPAVAVLPAVFPAGTTMTFTATGVASTAITGTMETEVRYLISPGLWLHPQQVKDIFG